MHVAPEVTLTVADLTQKDCLLWPKAITVKPNCLQLLHDVPGPWCLGLHGRLHRLHALRLHGLLHRLLLHGRLHGLLHGLRLHGFHRLHGMEDLADNAKPRNSRGECYLEPIFDTDHTRANG